MKIENVDLNKVVEDANRIGLGITFEDAVKILMKSPLYFRQSLENRLILVKEYVIDFCVQ